MQIIDENFGITAKMKEIADKSDKRSLRARSSQYWS